MLSPLICIPTRLFLNTLIQPPSKCYFGQGFVDFLQENAPIVFDEDGTPINIIKFFPSMKKGICSLNSAGWMIKITRYVSKTRHKKSNFVLLEQDIPNELQNMKTYNEQRQIRIMLHILGEYPDLTYPHILCSFIYCCERLAVPIPELSSADKKIVAISTHKNCIFEIEDYLHRNFYYYRLSIIGKNIEVQKHLLDNIIEKLMLISELITNYSHKDIYYCVRELF